MIRNQTIKLRLTKEELYTIDMESRRAGFHDRSSFIRHRILDENIPDITMAQTCQIRGQLENLKKLHQDDKITMTYINNIHNILDNNNVEGGTYGQVDCNQS